MRAVTAQLPTIEHSDDKIYTTPDAVIMLDGASAFVPVPVPASTYADRLGRHLRDTLTTQPEADLTHALAAAITDTAAALDLHAGQSPSSTVTIARRRGERLDLLILGDNLVILPDEVLTDDRIDTLDLAPRRTYRKRLAAGNGHDAEHRAILHELQTQQAQHRNRAGGYWIAEADPTAADHAITTHRTLSATPWAVLATDGAYNTMHHLGWTHWADLTHTTSEQLAAILQHCHDWEAHTDPHAQRLPRSKRHDDKALAALDLTT